MNSNERVLIVGAGPSGLAAALFLSEQGIRPRIVEKEKGLSLHSKALGVNPKTLLLLEQSGLTRRFLQNGRKMEKINFWKGEQLVFQNDFTKMKHKYPFMLIQPQKESEELLSEALTARGLEVTFQTELLSLQEAATGATVSLSACDGSIEAYDCRLVIGADGAKSKVRDLTRIKMEGFRYNEEWELYDVELEVPRHPDEGHVFVYEAGGMVMIRLKENIWRIAGNMFGLLNYLPKDTKVGEVIWRSTFRVGHRLAHKLQHGNVVLVGDAAHLHSPVGARGMNLGIEDAYIVSQLIRENRLNEYTKIRRGYLKRTVRRINTMTQALGGSGWLMKKARANVGMFRPLFPFAMPVARKFILGLNK